jgi:ribosome maturation factor RimP
VSSPGVDEPLVNDRQYKKNVGRTVEVTLLEGEPVTGVLKEVTEEALTLEVKIPKKKEVRIEVIPVNQVKQTVVQVVF